MEDKIVSMGTSNHHDVEFPISSTTVDLPKDEEKPPKKQNKFLSFLKDNSLTLLTILGVILGIALGFILRYSKGSWSNREIMYINFPGELFLRMLRCLIIPLITSSLVSAISGMDLSLSGKIARRAIALYLTTTFCAAVLGVVLVVTIRPGDIAGNIETTENTSVRNTTTVDALLDLVRNMFPPNMIQACTQLSRTSLTYVGGSETIREEYTDTTNIIGLVVISAVFGIVLASLREDGRTITDFFNNLFNLSMKVTRWVIWLSPVGVLFLVSSRILEVEDISMLVSQLGLYTVTVFSGIMIQGFLIIPLLFFICTRKNPYRFIVNMTQALATAFGTSSSSASLPITIGCVEDKCGVDSRIARFTIPIGTIINMDGTALYEAVAAIFIAQVRNVDLSIGSLIAISVTATAASIGAAGIPQAGLVTMVMVLDTVGLPAEDVTLIIAVDWLLDRFRTLINVSGDALICGIVNHLSQKELRQMNKLQDNSLAEKSVTERGDE